MANPERTRPAWITILFGLSLAGLIGAIAWAVFSFLGLEDRLADMPRVTVPGGVSVEVVEPGTLTIFYEDPTAEGGFVVQTTGTSPIGELPVELTVTGPTGEVVPVSLYGRDLRFDYDGRVVTAVAVFDASLAGTFDVRATGDVPDLARISVGRIVDVGVIANVIGVVGLFVLSMVGMAVAGAVSFSRSGRASSPDAAERPLVGV